MKFSFPIVGFTWAHYSGNIFLFFWLTAVMSVNAGIIKKNTVPALTLENVLYCYSSNKRKETDAVTEEKFLQVQKLTETSDFLWSHQLLVLNRAYEKEKDSSVKRLLP